MSKKKAVPFLLLRTNVWRREMTEEDAEESGSSDLLSDGFTGISEWA